MSWSPILEGVCIAFIGQLIIALFKAPSEKRLLYCLRAGLIIPLGLTVWGDNHDWPFAWRFFLTCISMFSWMGLFCVKKGPPTRIEIVTDVALPLFSLMLAAVDFRVRWAWEIVK